MVKNANGGNKSKGLARKGFAKRDAALRVACEEGEVYAQAVAVKGGSIATAIDLNGLPLIAHIRGKFRGRGKRDNFITAGTWLLVGLHSWEAATSASVADKKKIRNCDILEVYSDGDKMRLKSSQTFINWSLFIANDNKSIDAKSTDAAAAEDDFEFADESTMEYEHLISLSAAATASATSATIIIDNGVEINVDEI